MFPGIAKALMIAGLLLFVAGLIFYFGGSKLNWFGKLPGDIRIEKENFSFYAPITSMIIVSVLLSLLIFVVKRFK
jgi:hypothetical protein